MYTQEYRDTCRAKNNFLYQVFSFIAQAAPKQAPSRKEALVPKAKTSRSTPAAVKAKSGAMKKVKEKKPLKRPSAAIEAVDSPKDDVEQDEPEMKRPAAAKRQARKGLVAVIFCFESAIGQLFDTNWLTDCEFLRLFCFAGDKLESGVHVGPIVPYPATQMFAVKVHIDGKSKQAFQAGLSTCIWDLGFWNSIAALCRWAASAWILQRLKRSLSRAQSPSLAASYCQH